MAFQRQPQPHHAPVSEQDLQNLAAYLDGIAKDEFDARGYSMDPPTFEVQIGRVNAKIVTENRVWGFVELASGAIMKAASFKAPEPRKYERGNVHLPDDWNKWLSHYGPAYLK